MLAVLRTAFVARLVKVTFAPVIAPPLGSRTTPEISPDVWLQSGAESYRYEPEVEEFLRWSPSVQSAETRGAPASRPDPATGAVRHSGWATRVS